MADEHANVVLVEGGERQDCAELDEETQQVECTVDLGHGLVRVLLEDVGVLRSFDFVEELRAEHHVEVFQNPVRDVLAGLSLATSAAAAAGLRLLVLLVFVDDLLDGDLRRQLGEFVLAVDGVPVVDEERLQVFRN